MPSQSSIEAEVAKLILANSFEFVRATSQILQALTSLLLTAYIALLVAFCREGGLESACKIVLTFLPIILFCGSLGIALFHALSYRGKDLTFDEKGIPLDVFGTYEETLRSRRKHLFFPAVLTSLGIIAFVLSFFFVFVPNAKPSQPLKFESAKSCRKTALPGN